MNSVNMYSVNVAATRAMVNEMLSLRDEVLDWQLSQTRKANEQLAEGMKAWTSAIEMGDRINRAWARTLVDTFMPAKDEPKA